MLRYRKDTFSAILRERDLQAMALQISTAAHACALITREIRDYRKNLTVHYIIHHEGQRTEALGVAAQEILPHPAAETAMHFLQKPRKSENSALLGTAVARHNMFFGLATRDTLLTLCTINIDQFSTLKDITRHAWHLAWHALDAADYHSDPVNRSGEATEIIIRKRSALDLAGVNLEADVFSSAISALRKDKDAVRKIALTRGTSSLHTRSSHNPEYYPFAIAMEATEYILGQMNPSRIPKKKAVATALKVAREVRKTYDEIALKHWLGFAEPAQDMAWRGFQEDEIIGAAIHTSRNTYIRAIGYLIAEMAAIEPVSITRISDNYSPFADDVFNEKLHEKIVEQIYQDVIAQGLRQNSSRPFVLMANMQNQALTEGKTIGWCAAALQAAGTAFDSAQENGAEPAPYALKEFQSTKARSRWDDLKELGHRIVRSRRQGHPITMSGISELSRDIEGLKALRQSVDKTIKDPHHAHKISAANELRPDHAYKPSGPAPVAAPLMSAIPSYALPGLGLGTTRHFPVLTATRGEKNQDDDGKK